MQNYNSKFKSLLDQILIVAESNKLISIDNLRDLKNGESKIEDFLNWVHHEKGYLFHGSGILIPLNESIFSVR